MEISNGHNKEMAGRQQPSVYHLLNNHEGNRSKYQQDQALISCPRCDSTNTKFCYYNNYSLSQPRYFCKGCRRYWTKGGILRNVPVGGGCRKNKKPNPPNSAPFLNPKKPIFQQSPSKSMQVSNFTRPQVPYEPNDLSLSFDPFLLGNPKPNPNCNPGFLDMLKGGAVEPMCYGFSGEGNDGRAMIPFHGGSDGTIEPGMVDDDGDDGGGGGGGGGNNGVRDYWNRTGCSSTWHGLVNSSFF